MNCRGGKLIFNALFFSVLPAEAGCIDPQQRILHEISYRVLENGESQAWLALVTQANVCGSWNSNRDHLRHKNSLHAGCFSHSYETMFTLDPEALAKYQVCGTGPTMLADRLSWFYNLRCPTIARVRACPSGMHALHLAIQKTRSSETSLVC